MLRSKTTIILGVSYLLAISIGLLIPKPIDTGITSSNILSRLFHDALYASITVDLISNTFLFVPGLLILMHLFPRIEPHYFVMICSAGSIFVEFAQIRIPGRVSSVADIVLNISGMAITLFLLKAFPGLSHWIRGKEKAL